MKMKGPAAAVACHLRGSVIGGSALISPVWLGTSSISEGLLVPLPFIRPPVINNFPIKHQNSKLPLVHQVTSAKKYNETLLSLKKYKK